MFPIQFRETLPLGAVLALVACGSSPQTRTADSLPHAQEKPISVARAEQLPDSESNETAELEERGAAPRVIDIPTECAEPKSEICTPSASFVAQLCKRNSPDLALAMFNKGTPWKRAYLRMNAKAWYTGASRAEAVQLVLDEEVLVVASRTNNKGGFQVGGGSYDAVRWDGSCVSVMADEVTFRRPPVPAVASIRWRHLKNTTRQALLENRGINFRRKLYRDRCKSNRNGSRCQQAAVDLASLIASYVRKGGKVPAPKLEVW